MPEISLKSSCVCFFKMAAAFHFSRFSSILRRIVRDSPTCVLNVIWLISEGDQAIGNSSFAKQ